MFSVFRKDPEEFLRQATAKKKAGDMDGAIECLRKAYKQIAKTSINYAVPTFLRLPLYLQHANRNEEAWSEFNSLIANGHPNQMRTRELLPMDHSQIYDKMRLFLQREKQFKKAVKFGVLSCLSWAQGLYCQNRNDELEQYISRQSIDRLLENLLKKAERLDQKSNLLEVIMENIEELPLIDYARLGKVIDQAVEA